VGRHAESTPTQKTGTRGEELAWDQELQIDVDSAADAELHVSMRTLGWRQAPVLQQEYRHPPFHDNILRHCPHKAAHHHTHWLQ
jgi:hypothetical protein